MWHDILQFILSMIFAMIGGFIAIGVCILVGIIEWKGKSK